MRIWLGAHLIFVAACGDNLVAPDARPDAPQPDASTSCERIDPVTCPAPVVNAPGECSRTFGANQMISANDAQHTVNSEPHLAADAAGHVVAAWIASSATNDHIGIAYSDDSGVTFQRIGELSAGNDEHNDPVVLANDDGSFTIVWLGYDDTAGTDHIWGVRSTDHGHTFGTPFVVNDVTNTGLDKPWIFQAPDSNHTIFVSYGANNIAMPNTIQTVYLVKSINEGQTWSSATQVSPNVHDTSDLARVAADATNVWVTYVNAPGNEDGSTQNAIFVTRKAIGAASFGAAVQVSAPGESIPFSDPPIVVTGSELAIAYESGNQLTTAHIAFAHSIDGGVTFMHDPSIDDGCPASHYLPNMATGPDGHIHAFFFDGRYGGQNGALWHAKSTDGKTFGANEFVNDAAFPFTTDRTVLTWLGDYVGVAVANGKIYADWTDPRDGVESQIYVAHGTL